VNLALWSRPRRGRLQRLVVLLGGAALLAGCAASPSLTVDTLDEPWRCASVAWMELSDRPASIAEQRVRGEVMRALEAKGYTVDETDPDCLVSGLIFTGARPGSPVSVGVGAGSWGGNFGGSVGISLPLGGGPRTYGNLGVDFIDRELNAQVWRGTLEAAFPTPEPDDAQVAAAVQQVLASLPAPAAAAAP
jgi:hypothetical protein